VEDENNKTLAMARQMKAQHVTWRAGNSPNMRIWSFIAGNIIYKRWIIEQKVIPGLVNVYRKLWKDPPFLMGKSTIHSHFQ